MDEVWSERLKSQIENLVDNPGVYTFRDARGKIIYVGKAKSLKARVRSYFRDEASLAPRTQALVKSVRSLDFIATRSEVEALILECNLIKHFKPRYNVNLKDDKKYPYIRVTSREPFPSVRPTRDLSDDSARYFGPYTDAKAMRRSLKFLVEVFPVRTCKRRLPLKQPDRGCLNFHIGRCLGPCRGEITSQAYKRLVQQVCLYLSGRTTGLIRQLSRRMEEEARNLRFEEAGILRDRVRALEKISQRQTVVLPGTRDRDVIVVRAVQGDAVGFVLKVREGKLVGKEVYRLGFEGEPARDEIVSSFLEQYLNMTTIVPDEVLVEEATPEVDLVEHWLREKTGRHVRVWSPKAGKGRDLIAMAGRNADLLLSEIVRAGRPEVKAPVSLVELARWLRLPAIPATLEAYDISTTQGAEPVGSRVCFRGGKPVKTLYRHYTIRTVDGQDDFAMMQEVLARRWVHAVSGEEPAPDLVVVDGGLGQLTSALQGILSVAGEPGGEAGPQRNGRQGSVPPVIAIAKRLDEVYIRGQSEPIQIPHDSPALRLLQRVRDEAHRFAITHHRKRRAKESMRSELDGIRGIGPVLAKRLLAAFGSVQAMRGVGAPELATVRGMSKARVEAVLKALAADEVKPN